MREKDMMRTEDNPTVYSRLRKRYICRKTGKCYFCPMHGVENASRQKYRERDKSKPKFTRKTIRKPLT